MNLGFASLMGRLLIIPVALSGVCLSMLFGVPTTEAMITNDLNNHETIVVENQEQESQPACCTTIRMKHDTKATTSNSGKTLVTSFVADIQKEAAAWKFEDATSMWTPSDSLSPHQPFSLTGIIFKRE